MLYVAESLDMKESFGNIWNQRFFLKLTSCVPLEVGHSVKLLGDRCSKLEVQAELGDQQKRGTIGFDTLPYGDMGMVQCCSIKIGNVQNDANVNLAETACFFSSARWSLQQCRRQMYPLRRIGNALNSWRRW